MRSPRYALLAVAALLALPLVAPATSAAPPPEDVCGVCGHEFEQTAADLGANVTVVESELDVRVAEAGSSRWTARVWVDERGAEHFAANRTLLEQTVERTYESGYTVVDNPRNLSVTLDERLVVVTFTVDDAAQRYPGGVVVFDAVASDSADGNPRLVADEVTVRGPPSTVVTHAPSGASSEGNRSVWTAGETVLVRDSVVAFAPDGGVASQTATAAVIRWHGLEAAAPGLLEFALVPAGLLALVATGLLLAGRHLQAALGDPNRVTRALAVGAGLYAVVAVGGGVVDADFAFVLAVVGVLLVPQVFLTAAVLLAAGRTNGVSPPIGERSAGVTVAAWTLVLVLGAPFSNVLALLASPLVFLPFGVLAGADHPGRLAFPAVVVLGTAAAALPFVDQVGLLLVSPEMLAGHAIVTAALGVPLFTLGRRFGDAASSGRDASAVATATE
ncbi:hypothetical protein SAMN05216559_1331 [Halomicrobium zhouii]|uniref:Uncharacterized protein n=1 Tax=Halomicrobium zhouii TaxID=767519 RepID=A0A1I6KQR7_9EURY|nr:hypothetical protein [Halomicrobium zhouii]SFR93602.1 hypothetical protein SAMN05216559_1331 [Halomicrobium zhouii]